MLLVLLITFSLPALAQDYVSGEYGPYLQQQDEKKEDEETPAINQYAKKYKKQPAANTLNQGLLPQHRFLINFVRTPDTAANEATLRFSVPLALNGCVKMSQPTIETQKNGKIMWITVSDPVVSVDRSVRYAHYDCKQGAFGVYADVDLNRDELIENNISQIAFKAGTAITDYYDVTIGESSLSLLPRTTVAFAPREMADKTDPLRYEFYPDNIVILYAPLAKNAPELPEKITNLAQSRGLIDPHIVDPAFTPSVQNNGNFYFIDQSGRFANGLKYGDNVIFGAVTVPQRFESAAGPYEKPKRLDVYARLPGLLD